jgi:hypothetical protein
LSLSPLDFFREYAGKYIDPDASATEVLMRTYPHVDVNKKKPVRLGGSEPARFLVSADCVKIWAPVSFPMDIASKVAVAPTAARKKSDWMIDVIMSPPKPPYLAVSLGMAAADLDFWRLSLTDNFVVFSGASALLRDTNIGAIDRNLFFAARDWFLETNASVSELLRLQETDAKFKRGTIKGVDVHRIFSRFKTPLAVLKNYPGQKEPFIMKLASYAASGWVPA